MGKTGKRDKKELYQVVDVVKHSKYQRINEQERFTAFVASGQEDDPQPFVKFEVRFAGTTPPVAAVRDEIVSAL